jgi:hypothetical protein
MDAPTASVLVAAIAAVGAVLAAWVARGEGRKPQGRRKRRKTPRKTILSKRSGLALPAMSIDQEGGTATVNATVIHFSDVWPAEPVCGAERRPSTENWAFVSCEACLELRVAWRETGEETPAPPATARRGPRGGSQPAVDWTSTRPRRSR